MTTHNMKVITFLNEKGGVGKTTLATSLAAGLALRGLRGLIIDADGQGDSSKAVGLTEAPDCYDFIMRLSTPVGKLISPVPKDFCQGELYIVRGNDEARVIPMNRSTEAIQDAFLKRFRTFRDKLDFVIFDTQPSPTSLHSAIATITDQVIIPFECEGFSIRDMDSAVAHMNAIHERARASGLDKARIIGLVPNKYAQHTILHKDALRTVRERYGDLVWQPIPNSISIPSHQYLHETVLTQNPDHIAAKAIMRFINRAHQSIFEVIR